MWRPDSEGYSVTETRRASKTEASVRAHLRRHLEAHLKELGYSAVRTRRSSGLVPEIARLSPTRGRIVYGETVLSSDMDQPVCHQRLLFFSQRRTRHRSSILFFIGVPEGDVPQLNALLEELAIRGGTRGGHVHIVPISVAEAEEPKRPKRRVASKSS